MSTNEIRVPDIGDFKDVPIIEVHVQPGSQINVDDPLISLESDKATMEVPASQAGTVKEIKVKVGDRVSMGDLIVVMEGAGASAAPAKERITEAAAPSPGGGAPGYGSPSGVYESVEIRVPDIGDFKNVPIIEVHVQPGATISADDPLISLESDKATMEVPAPQGGTVKDIKVKVGDRVSEGDLIVTLEGQGASAGAAAVAGSHAPGTGQAGYGSSALDAKGNGAGRASAPASAAKPAVTGQGDHHAEVLVLGAGPGGYTAAFRAADLGKKVVLVERWPSLGGVCLNVGCIPSKALLHAAKVIDETKDMSAHGIAFSEPSIDIDKLRGWKDGVVKKLTGGLSGLAKQRKVTVVSGVGRFTAVNQLEVEADGGKKTVSFEQAIIAAGSEPVTLPFIPHDDPRVIDSTGALALDGEPKRLLVIGGGIIGLEMATVYHSLGTEVTIVELMDQIIPGADKDI